MLSWIVSNLGNLVVCGALLLIVTGILVHLVHKHKNGGGCSSCGSCGGGCGGCGGCSGTQPSYHKEA